MNNKNQIEERIIENIHLKKEKLHIRPHIIFPNFEANGGIGNIMTKENIYFLGAGSSAPGIPTIDNFSKKSIEIFKDENHLYNLSLDIYKIFYKVLYNWEEWGFDKYDIEKYYHIIEMGNYLQIRYKVTEEEVIDFIQYVINESFNICRNEYGWYETFLKNILSKDSGIITTNWDKKQRYRDMLYTNECR